MALSGAVQLTDSRHPEHDVALSQKIRSPSAVVCASDAGRCCAAFQHDMQMC